MKILYRATLLATLLAGWLSTAPSAHAMVYWRVSVKIFLDANGQRPTATNTFNYSTPARVRKEFEDYNNRLDRMGWGYRLDLTEVVELSGLSEWFSLDARNGENRADLERQSKLHPIQYAYRPNALNVYVNNSSSGISGGHLPLIGDIIFVGAQGYWTLILHEIGHGLGLCHTHGCFCNDNCINVPDGIEDTILDSDQWANIDAISNGNFSSIYANLTAARKRQVDFIWGNIMSYHGNDTSNPLMLLTHDQWERVVDVSNSDKRDICSGKTVFVDRNSSGLSPCELFNNIAALAEYLPGPSSWYVDALNAHPPSPEVYLQRTCQPFDVDPPFPPAPPGYPGNWPWPPTPAFPNPPPGYPSGWPWPPVDPPSLQVCVGGYKTVKDALTCGASDGDRLQIKAGNYNETLRMNRPVTLATDRGTVAIGRP